jgi:hypothetical protein
MGWPLRLDMENPRIIAALGKMPNIIPLILALDSSVFRFKRKALTIRLSGIL